MKALIYMTAALLLMSCDSPSPAFMDSEKTRIEIEGSTFSVHRRENEVEVYRISKEWLPRLDVVLARSRKAIELATGCAVVPDSLIGDQAIQTAKLSCG